MFSSVRLFKHPAKYHRFHSTKINTPYSEPILTFSSVKEFNQSTLFSLLSALFDSNYHLNPHGTPKLKTLSMQVTLDHLGLTSIYKDNIDPNKYLLGIHGASLLSAPQIIPYLTSIKAMNTFHNPFHTESGPIWFFYGNNISMALHYSALNAINTETINGDSDPRHYPDKIGILGFADKEIIDAINQTATAHAGHHETTTPITCAPTIAWKQRHNHGIPDEFHIGNEIRLPRAYHPQVINLLTFQIKGGQRLFPLDTNTQYLDGKTYKWLKGQGFVSTENEAETRLFETRR